MARRNLMRTCAQNAPLHLLERLLCFAAGVLLVDRGLRRGGVDGIVSVVAGSFLTARGIEGRTIAARLSSDEKRREAAVEKDRRGE